jgi:hypothetical protein
MKYFGCPEKVEQKYWRQYDLTFLMIKSLKEATA